VIPWVLQAVALTNRPFKKELPAVANSDAAAAGLIEAGADLSNSAVASQEGTAMDQLLVLLAAAMSLDAKAVANSLGVAEDAKADVVVPALAKLLSAGDQASKRPKVFANSLGVAETADDAAIAAALAAKAGPKAESETKLLAICNSVGASPNQPLTELLTLLGATRANPAQAAAERMIENAITVEHKIAPCNRQAFLDVANRLGLEAARKMIAGMPAILNSVTSAPAAEAAAASAVLTSADEWVLGQHGLKKEDYLAAKKRLAD
jgi:hypothetical protein